MIFPFFGNSMLSLDRIVLKGCNSHSYLPLFENYILFFNYSLHVVCFSMRLLAGKTRHNLLYVDIFLGPSHSFSSLASSTIVEAHMMREILRKRLNDDAISVLQRTTTRVQAPFTEALILGLVIVLYVAHLLW